MIEPEMIYGGDSLPHDPTQEAIYRMAAQIRAERTCGDREPPQPPRSETAEFIQARHAEAARAQRHAADNNQPRLTVNTPLQ